MGKSVVNLSATGSREIENDTISITFSVTKEGTEFTAVQEELKQAVGSALSRLKPEAKGGIDIETGSFHVGPRYDKKEKLSGYTGYTSLIVSGTYIQDINELISGINSMSIAGIGHTLSMKKRRELEAELTDEAMHSFCEKATTAADLLGAIGFIVKEITITPQGNQRSFQPFRGAIGASMEQSPLPMETGKSTVGVDITGSVYLRYKT